MHPLAGRKVTVEGFVHRTDCGVTVPDLFLVIRVDDGMAMLQDVVDGTIVDAPVGCCTA